MERKTHVIKKVQFGILGPDEIARARVRTPREHAKRFARVRDPGAPARSATCR